MRKNFERYLVLVNILMYMQVSPIVAARVKLEDLWQKKVMGMYLLTEEEYRILAFTKNPNMLEKHPPNAFELPGSAGNGPMNSVLVWLSMLFDKATAEGAFRSNIEVVRHTSLSIHFQKNLQTLRGAMAHFNFQTQLPVPLAYAHLIQTLVDAVVLVSPFAVIYEINTVVVSRSGYTHDIWNTLPLTLLAVILHTYFWLGLRSLAKVFISPLGEKMSSADPKTSFLVDEDFCINVLSIMKQTRLQVCVFFNTATHAPEICFPNGEKPVSVKPVYVPASSQGHRRSTSY